MSLAAPWQLPNIRFALTEGGRDPVYSGSSKASESRDRPRLERFARCSSISDMIQKVHADRWLLTLRPPSPKTRARALAIDLWTCQELAKVAKGPKEMISKAWCLGTLRDTENCRAGEGEVQDSLKDDGGTFSVEDVKLKSPKLLGRGLTSREETLDSRSTKILLSREKSVNTRSSDKQRRMGAHLKTAFPLTEAMNNDINENKGDATQILLLSVSPSDTTKAHSRLAAYKSLERERNGNNVYDEQTIPSGDGTFQSSVDMPDVCDGGAASVSLEPRVSEEELPRGETELPNNKISYARLRADPSETADDGTGIVAASSKLSLDANLTAPKTSYRLRKRPGSLSAMQSFIQNWGFKTHRNDRPSSAETFLPKADSEIINRIKSSTLALTSGLQAKAVSDVVVSTRTTATETTDLPFEVRKKKKAKRAKRSSMKDSVSQLRPPLEGKEVSRSEGNFSRKQVRELQSRTSGKHNKLLSASSPVMMVDYRQASSDPQNAPKADEECQKSKMKKALLSVYEYDLNGHRQSKIVITSRQPKKTPSNENGLGLSRVRMRGTRRLTAKTVAASPSVITNLWRQIDKNRLRRSKEQQDTFRSLPLQVRHRKEVTIAESDASFLYQRVMASLRKNIMSSPSSSNVDPYPWTPDPIVELEEEEGGINSMKTTKSSSLLVDQAPPSECHALGTCIDDEKETIDKDFSRICHEQENIDDGKASALDLSVLPQQRQQRLSNQRFGPVELKTVRPKYSDKKKELPVAHRVSGTWLGNKASWAKLGKKPPIAMSNMSADKSLVRAEKGARRTAARRKSRKCISHLISAIDGTSAGCRLANKRSDDLTAENPSQPSRTSSIPVGSDKPRSRLNTAVSRKNRLSAGEGGKAIRKVPISRMEVRSNLPVTEAIVEKRNKRPGPRGRKKSSKPRKPSVLSRNYRTDREATGDGGDADTRLSPCVTQGKPQCPAESSLPKQGLAIASETNLKQPSEAVRLSPALPVQQVTAASADPGDKTFSSLSINSDTIASATLLYETFPSVLVEAERNRGSPLKRFGSSLSARLHFHQIMNAARVGGT